METHTCGWSGCDVIVDKINPRTERPFYYCCSHSERRKHQKKCYYQANKDKWIKTNNKTKERWHALRKQFVEMYGGQCACCGISEMIFLSLEHVNNDGKSHRKERGVFGVYMDATKQYQPDRFQVLCRNCNFAKYQFGYCPHQLACIEEN